MYRGFKNEHRESSRPLALDPNPQRADDSEGSAQIGTRTDSGKQNPEDWDEWVCDVGDHHGCDGGFDFVNNYY